MTLRFWFGLVVLINVDLAIFQPYLDLEAGDNQSLKMTLRKIFDHYYGYNSAYDRWIGDEVYRAKES